MNTGGAGLIGSHLADELLAPDCRVRVLDTLSGVAGAPAAVWPIGSEALTRAARVAKGKGGGR